MHLETSLTEYLPDFYMLSAEYKDITVRMLLNHSSGLPGFNCRGSVTDMPWPEYQSATYQLIKQSRLKHRPGYMHVYCNDGYTLLERAVQAVTGIPFADYVRQEIFAPLGMTNSYFSSSIPPEGSIARGFHNGRKLPLEVVNTHAAAGVYSTPQDIARFIAMIIVKGSLSSGLQDVAKRFVKKSHVKEYAEMERMACQVFLETAQTPEQKLTLGRELQQLDAIMAQ